MRAVALLEAQDASLETRPSPFAIQHTMSNRKRGTSAARLNNSKSDGATDVRLRNFKAWFDREDRRWRKHRDGDGDAEYIKDLSDLEDAKVFYQQGLSVAGNPVFYTIARRVDPGMNLDLLMFHVMRTMRPILLSKDKSRVDFVLDMACFNKVDSPIQTSWVLKLIALWPIVASERIGGIYVLHPSTYFFELADLMKFDMDSPLTMSSMRKRMHLFVHSSSLAPKYIPPAMLALPEDSLAIEKNLEASWANIQVLPQRDVHDALINLPQKRANAVRYLVLGYRKRQQQGAAGSPLQMLGVDYLHVISRMCRFWHSIGPRGRI